MFLFYRHTGRYRRLLRIYRVTIPTCDGVWHVYFTTARPPHGPAMFSLDDDDLYLNTEVEAPPVAHQTSSIGLKQSSVRWLPAFAASEDLLAISGSWDEEANELSVWSLKLDGATGDAMGDEFTSPILQVGSTPHDGCVLGLSVAGNANGAPPVAYTASGAGGACCFTIDFANDGGVVLTHQWRAAVPVGGLATLGVSWGAEAGCVAAAGEDGKLAVLHPESGATIWSAQTNEPSLFDTCWWGAQSPHAVFTAGKMLAMWDTRQKAMAPQLTLAPVPEGQVHLGAQLLCISTEPVPSHKVAAGASDGAIHIWDVRSPSLVGSGRPPQRTIARAHSSDVWGLQLGRGTHGDLLSCGSDGTVQSWQLEPAMADGDGAPLLAAEEMPTEMPLRTLVQLSMPINDLELSGHHGVLASASDAQVLTFIDLRS